MSDSVQVLAARAKRSHWVCGFLKYFSHVAAVTPKSTRVFKIRSRKSVSCALIGSFIRKNRYVVNSMVVSAMTLASMVPHIFVIFVLSIHHLTGFYGVFRKYGQIAGM